MLTINCVCLFFGFFYSTFTVSLKCGQSVPGYPEPNEALHLSFRFNERKIVRNTYIPVNGWGPEEFSGGFPLNTNSPFQLDIYAEDFSFKIHLNNTYFAEYKYRLAINTIKVLSIGGSVNIFQIRSEIPPAVGNTNKGFHRAQKAPPPPYTPYPTPSVPGLPVFLNAVVLPTTVPIPGNMTTGMSFSISGTPLNGNKFDFNWVITSNDYALHISARIPKQELVRNTKRGTVWGPEERAVTHFPFFAGTIFHLLVKCLSTHFEISVNGKLLAHYNHRYQPYTSVNALNIHGDVIIHSINITA
ncbi:hypothetical protein CHUAL_007496 [Chamberlinius hualienensis]